MLDELLQAQLLKLDGVYLMQRRTKRLRVEFYALYNFYVEVFYNKADNEPLYFKSFEGGRNLNVYLEAIVIDDIFEKL